MHVSAASHEASAASSLAMFAWAPGCSPPSNRRAASATMSAAASVSAKARAMGNCTAWFCPIGPVEDAPLARIGRRAVDEEPCVADALGRDQDALGVHGREDAAEPFALLADPVSDRDLEIVEEQFAGGMVDHRRERADLEPLAHGPAHVDQEDRKAVGPSLAFAARRGAREQEKQVGMPGARGPDLLAVDDVAVALPAGEGSQRRGIGAAFGLRHAERLEAKRA